MEELEIISILTGEFSYRKAKLIVQLEKLKYGKIKRTCFNLMPKEYEYAVEQHSSFEKAWDKNFIYQPVQLHVFFPDGERLPVMVGVDDFDYHDYIDEIITLAKAKEYENKT